MFVICWLIDARWYSHFGFHIKYLILSLVHMRKRYQRFGKAIACLFIIGVNVLVLIYTFFAFWMFCLRLSASKIVLQHYLRSLGRLAPNLINKSLVVLVKRFIEGNSARVAESWYSQRTTRYHNLNNTGWSKYFPKYIEYLSTQLILNKNQGK